MKAHLYCKCFINYWQKQTKKRAQYRCLTLLFKLFNITTEQNKNNVLCFFYFCFVFGRELEYPLNCLCVLLALLAWEWERKKQPFWSACVWEFHMKGMTSLYHWYFWTFGFGNLLIKRLSLNKAPVSK